MNETGASLSRAWGFSDPMLSYLAPVGVARLAKFVPQATKLVLLIREPIQHAHSQYQMDALRARQRGASVPSFEAVALAELGRTCRGGSCSRLATSLLLRGLYAEQLAALLQHFRNIWLGISECILQNQTREYNRMFAFLGLSTAAPLRELSPGASRTSRNANALSLNTSTYSLGSSNTTTTRLSGFTDPLAFECWVCKLLCTHTHAHTRVVV